MDGFPAQEAGAGGGLLPPLNTTTGKRPAPRTAGAHERMYLIAVTGPP